MSAPRGATETALAEIWAELLGVERVGRHDNFFELGGHSLLAVQLLSRALNLGMKFNAADLFQAPALKHLASRIELDPQGHTAGVLPVRPTGTQPPLFFVPTGYGDYSYVLTLAKEMDVNCPIYALPWPSFIELRQPTLDAIAAEVIVAIRKIQPQGPYRFAGYSSGAILAYAIAKHLLSRGEAVSFMAFIDVTLPANPSSRSDAQVALDMIFEPLESLDDERFKLLEKTSENSSVAELFEKAQQIGAIASDRDLYDKALRYVYFHRALRCYRAPTLPIEIHQFYAADAFPNRRVRGKNSIDPEASSIMRGWDRVLSGAAIHAVSIPGNHVTMMSSPENRDVLAHMLSRALNDSPATTPNCTSFLPDTRVSRRS